MTRRRDNFGRFTKNLTVHIKKELQSVAKEYQVNLETDLKNQMLETYVTNVLNSFHARSPAGKAIEDYNNSVTSANRKKPPIYKHTNIFVSSIYTTCQDHTVKVMIRDDEKYPTAPPSKDGKHTPKEKSAVDVYEYLRHGTKADGKKIYPYVDPVTKKVRYAPNYTTPPHNFDETSQAEINDYVSQLKLKIESGTYRVPNRYRIRRKIRR